MLLAVDIGNSNTVFAVFRGRKIISKGSFPTSSIGKRNLHTKKFGAGVKFDRIDGVIVSSVVPQYTPKLIRRLKQIFKVNPIPVSSNLKLGIRLGYKNPNHIGQDRLANAVAGYKLYGGPIIIVDYGTAITICLVTKTGYYKGGIILPGIEMIGRALSEKTALLPYVKTLKKPAKVIGQDTKESIISGMVYGLSEMVDGLVRRVKKGRGKVITTGGAAKFFFPYSKEIGMIDKDLTLKGLRLIYEMNKNEMD